ncbi:MAG TPA: DUF1015 domain-containing protein [Chloroflexota bacterium]|nr:DUF1015 domain-containing protein [Chloroflexota bacterium]
MADIRPFRGWRFNPARVGDLSQVIAPPYDVISPDDQQRLYARSPYNVVRVELTQPEPSDAAGAEGDAARHARARATLASWIEDGVLQQDEAPSLYLYEQQYRHGGATRALRSILAAVRLAPWSAGSIVRHEHTLARPRQERLGLLRATATNISPIWSLYEDPTDRVAASLEALWVLPPETAAVDEWGVRHSLRVARDAAALGEVMATLAEQPFFIADGHHRYETALAYQAEMRERHSGVEELPSDFVLMMLTTASTEGLLVLPTHRLFHNIPEDRLARLPERLSRAFAVNDLTMPDEPEQLQALLDRHLLAPDGTPLGRRFILLGPEPARLRLLTLQDPGITAAAPAAPLADLDVWLAHEAILDRMLGMDAASLTRQEHLTYTRDAAEAARSVRSGESQLALFLAYTPVRQLLAVARAGAVMPQKSTYFYPKPATGMVIRRMD